MLFQTQVSWALSIVVTPGSSASYLYFPPAQSSGQNNNGNASSSTITLAGVGGVSISKSGGFVGYTLAHAPSGSSCGASCGFAQFNTAQVEQSATCNALHGVAARLARWLLLINDRTQELWMRFQVGHAPEIERMRVKLGCGVVGQAA